MGVRGFSLRKRQDVEETVTTNIELGAPEGASTGTESLHNLRRFEKAHRLDPNLPIEDLRDVDAALANGNVEKGLEVEQGLLEDNSPYPEVRAAVRNNDEEIPANTIRAWTIGLILCAAGSALNVVFSLRSPSVTITSYVVQLVAYPLGLFWDLIMPNHEWRIMRLKFNLKPGKFNYKEHVIIGVMSNAAFGGGAMLATDIIITNQVWYKQFFGWGWQIFLGITTICTGYGIAGLARRFLVWPAAMIWPQALANAALLHTLHDHAPSLSIKTNGWEISRYRFFLIVAVGSFVWYFFPAWIFQGLSWFCWVTWIYPDNVVVNQIFGGTSGYGLLPMTFDWNIVSGYLTSPLVSPFHAIANVTAGVLLFFVFTSIGLQYTGAWYSRFLPVQSSRPYDNSAYQYNVTKILTNFQFDQKKYSNYSPIYFPTQVVMACGLSFAAVAAILVHVGLYNGPQLIKQFKLARNQDDDIHMRLIKKYRDAADWWYATLTVIMVALVFIVACAWPTGFPWWACIVSLFIAAVWTVPIGIIQAATNIQVGLGIVPEYLAGHILTGRPLAVVLFKNYTTSTISQAMLFAQDLKLGHYMKVPPRTIFWAQVVAGVFSAIVQVAMLNGMFSLIPDLCSDKQAKSWTCLNAKGLYTTSVVWGGVGSARLFGPGSLYASLQWFWLVGAVTPLVAWLLARRYPRSLWRYINMPLVFSSSGYIPQATVYIYLCWAVVGTTFNFFIRRRWTGWWLHYNYITSVALDCGTILCMALVMLALYIGDAEVPQWFGNLDTRGTLDMLSRAVTARPPMGEKFGPKMFS